MCGLETNFRVVSLTIVLLVAMGDVSHAATPTAINYQGRLTNSSGTAVPDGSYSVTFTIYDAPSGGTIRWTETQSVTTVGGLFAVLLGTVTPLTDTAFNGTTRYLGVRVGADSELSPRTRLVSVPYSERVSTIDGSMGGSISGNISVGSTDTVFANSVSGLGSLQLQTSGTPRIHLDGANGNVGIGTISPTAELEVVGDMKVSGNIIGSTAWTPFPYAAGYEDYLDAYPGIAQRVQYRKIGDVVYLRGLALKVDHTPIPSGTIIGTLPVGFRPPAGVDLSTGNPATAVFEILPTGDVVSYGDPVEFQALDGLSFSTTP